MFTLGQHPGGPQQVPAAKLHQLLMGNKIALSVVTLPGILQALGTPLLHFTALVLHLLESYQLPTCNEEARTVLH